MRRAVSQQNVELVRQSQEAWNAGGIDALVAMIPPDGEWVVAKENPNARTLRGPDEIRAYLRDWNETMPELRYEPAERIDAGNAVVTLGTAAGRAGADGPEVAVKLAFVIRFEDGVPVRTEEYLDEREALAAAGIEANRSGPSSAGVAAGSNVEIVRRHFEGWERAFERYADFPGSLVAALEAGDIAADEDFLRYLHPEVEWNPIFSTEGFKGLRACARAWDDLLEAAGDYGVRLRELIELDDERVLAVVDSALEGKSSGIDVGARVFAVTTIRDGLIVRIDEYLERSEALAAAARH